MFNLTPQSQPSGLRSSSDIWEERRLILSQFIKNPLQTATVAPSSRHLARRMAEAMPLAHASQVVELGPGTGAFTRELIPRLRPRAKFLAVERNPELAAAWRTSFPHHELAEGCVSNLRSICAGAGIKNADCVMSGLPWPAFTDELRQQGLDGVLATLRPGGQMIMFGYHLGLMMPAGQRFIKTLKKRFRNVESLSWEWRNLPPAYILRCTR